MTNQSKLSGNLRSLELLYRPVYSTEYQSVTAYCSQLRINDPGIGVILPEQYLPVALRSTQCCRLAKWALDSICDGIATLRKREAYFEWLSVYIPTRMLLEDDFIESLTALFSEKETDPKFLRIELAPEIMYEEPDSVNPVFDRLHEMGIKLFIGRFGGDFCPVLRLIQFHIDAVLLDSSLSAAITSDNMNDTVAQSVFDMIGANNIEIIADNIDTSAAAKLASSYGCTLSVGAYAGKYRKISGIRA